MEIFLFLLAGLALLGSLVLVLPAELRVRYGREGEKDVLEIDLSLWRFLFYRYRVDMVDFRAGLGRAALHYRSRLEGGGGRIVAGDKKKIKVPGFKEIFRKLFFLRDIYAIVRPSVDYIANHTRITCLAWKTRFGLDDPYRTGMATGVIWSLKGYLVSFLFSRITMSGTPMLSVIPDFSRACLEVRFDCRLVIRSGFMMYAGLRMLAALLFSGSLFKILKMAR